MNMPKITLVFIFSFVVYGQALAVNKCKDASGRVIYQEAACDMAASGSRLKVWKDGGEETSTTESKGAQHIDLVDLQEATIVILHRKSSGFSSLTLRPKWKNDNSKKVRVHYRTQFFDSSKTEIGVDRRFKDLDERSTSTTTQVLGASDGGASSKFDYTKLSRAVISYRVDKDRTEKTFANVTLKRVTE